MRRSKTLSLGEALGEFISENNFGRKLKEVDIVQSWELLLGKTIAHYTRNIELRNRILFVEISSGVVKNELFMMREEICRKLNENAGENLVDKIIFK